MLSKKELRIIIKLIDNEQFGGIKYAYDNVWLDDIKKKILEYLGEKNCQ